MTSVYYAKLREFRDAVIRQPGKTEFDVRVLIDNNEFLYTGVSWAGHYQLNMSNEPYYYLVRYLDENGYSWFYTHSDAENLQSVGYKTTVKLSEIKGGSEEAKDWFLRYKLQYANRSSKAYDGYAMQFERSNDYVQVNSSSSLKLPTLAISYWFKPGNWSGNSYDGTHIRRLGTGLSRPHWTYGARNGDSLVFEMRGDDGAYHSVATSKKDWNTSIFYYVVAQYNNITGFWGIYVNGMLDSSKTEQISPSLADGTFNVGGFTGSSKFNGTIADVRVYNRTLNSSEILAAYYNGSHSLEGLVLYLPFNETAGNISYDSSGSGNDGTIYGANRTYVPRIEEDTTPLIPSGSRFAWSNDPGYHYSMTGLENPYNISFSGTCAPCDVFAVSPRHLRIYSEKNATVVLNYPVQRIRGVLVDGLAANFTQVQNQDNSTTLEFNTSSAARTSDVLLIGEPVFKVNSIQRAQPTQWRIRMLDRNMQQISDTATFGDSIFIGDLQDNETYTLAYSGSTPNNSTVSVVLRSLNITALPDMYFETTEGGPSLPAGIVAASPLVAVNAGGVEYAYAEVTLPLSTAANRILHCLSYNFTDASCSNWASNATSAYTGTFNSTHFVFNVTSFDAYVAGYYASCSDGVQDQGEQGLDCGGPCSACASGTSSPSGGGGVGGAVVTATNLITIAPGAQAITKITVALRSAFSSPSLSSAPLLSVPVVAPSGPVYQYFNISPIGFGNSDIANASVEFRVNKSWTAGKNIMRVYLLRYSNGWTRLGTEFVGSTGAYSTYRASVNAFSYFAIAGEPAAVPVVEALVVANRTPVMVVGNRPAVPALISQADIDTVREFLGSVVLKTEKAGELLEKARLQLSEAQQAFDAGEQKQAAYLLSDAKVLGGEAANMCAALVDKSGVFTVLLVLVALTFGSYAYCSRRSCA